MNKIRIALIGSVSVGKSTLINTLFVKQFSKSKIKRTTMVPYIFQETNNLLSKEEIAQMENKINNVNTEIIKLTENPSSSLTLELCKPITFLVPRIFDLISLKNANNIELEFYDIPGLNDNRTQNVYFEWVEKNFYLFDIIIFMTSIDKALNETDELNILKFIMNNIKLHKDKYNRNIALLSIVNKCDNMIYDNGVLNFSNSDNEYLELFTQIENTIKVEAKNYGIIVSKLLPISLEDSFIYRIFHIADEKELDDIDDKYYHKLGINAYGKTKWNMYVKEDFNKYKKILINLINDKKNYIENIKNSGYFDFRNLFNGLIEFNQIKFLTERLNYNITDRIKFDFCRMLPYFNIMFTLHDREMSLNNTYKQDNHNVLKTIYTDIETFLGTYECMINSNIKNYDIDMNADELNNILEYNLEKFKNYIYSIDNIKAILRDTKTLESFDSLLQSKILAYTKKIIETYFEYILCNYLNMQCIKIIEIISLLINDLNYSFNLNLGRNIFIADLNLTKDMDIFINKLLINFIFVIKDGHNIKNIDEFLNFININKLCDNKKNMKKLILHLIANDINIKLSNVNINKATLCYLVMSEKLLRENLMHIDVVPFYCIIRRGLNKYLQLLNEPKKYHKYISKWFASENTYCLPLEYLYLSLIES